MAITELIKVVVMVELFSEAKTPIYFLGILITLSSIPLYYFNYKKENKVFLGDAGSLLYGSLIAVYLFHVLGSEFTFKEQFKLNKPLFTMSLKSPFSPDQNHIHHLLINKGYSHFKIVLTIQLISLAFLALVEIIA